MNGCKDFEFTEMILQALEDRLDDDQFAQFDKMLREEAAFRQYYLQFMAVHTALSEMDVFQASNAADDSILNCTLWRELAKQEKTAESIEQADESVYEPLHLPPTPRPTLRINKSSLVTVLISAAAMIFLIVYAHFAPVKTDSALGSLTRTVNARWQNVSGQILEGNELYAGPMDLIEGYAEITLNSGATLIVQAPSQFTLESKQQVLLQHGQMVVSVQNSAEKTFVVRSPSASVVDFGTEFGVQVDSKGQTQTYVYQGKVQIRNSSDPVKFMDGLFLGAGQGGAADINGTLAERKIDPKLFVRQNELDARYYAQKESGYYRWRTSIYNLQRDPSLVAHYFFERSAERPLCLVNAVCPDDITQQGTFGDTGRSAPTWTQGRWPQKEAVRFERGKDQCILVNADSPLSLNGPLTISTWVCFPNESLRGGHLISCRDGYHVNYQFSLFDDKYVYPYQSNRFEFLRFNQKDKGAYSRPFVTKAGKWYHLAAVYDTSYVSFYVDGVLWQKIAYDMPITGCKAQVVLGAMKVDGQYILKEGDFDGIVDELMIFNRGLSESEIQSLYQNGSPETAG